ncbi:hypothetical protein [Modestobacter marinus]|uniref:hypothetical protein n=1 Tax=Modestobacter marinus TaxID=477641 RepID=UPI001E315BA3|nr:hypothetical protein [Modestobacter marinus]
MRPAARTVGLALGAVLAAGVVTAGPAAALEDPRRPTGTVTHGPSCGPAVVRVQVTNGTEPHRVALVFDGVEEQDAADLLPGEQVELTSGDVDWGVTVDVSVTVADPDGTTEPPLEFRTYTRPSEEDCAAVAPPTTEPPAPTSAPTPDPEPSGSPVPSTPAPDPTPTAPPSPTATPTPSAPSSPPPSPEGPSTSPPPSTPTPTTAGPTPSSPSGPRSSGPGGTGTRAPSPTRTEPPGTGSTDTTGTDPTGTEPTRTQPTRTQPTSEPSAPSLPADPGTAAPAAIVSPGGVVTVRASGFDPGETVDVRMAGGTELLGTVTAAADGSVEAVVQIPRGTALGAATLELVGGESAATAEVGLRVAARAAAATEQTGSPAVLAAGLVLLTAAGSLGLVGVRRARSGHPGGRR